MDHSLFSELPRELRDEIWRLALTTPDVLNLSADYGDDDEDDYLEDDVYVLRSTTGCQTASALTRTCKQIRRECLALPDLVRTLAIVPDVFDEVLTDRSRWRDVPDFFTLLKCDAWLPTLADLLSGTFRGSGNRFREVEIRLGSFGDTYDSAGRGLPMAVKEKKLMLSAPTSEFFWTFEVLSAQGTTAISMRLPIATRDAQEAAVKQWFRAEVRKLTAAKRRGEITTEVYGHSLVPLQGARRRVEHMIRQARSSV